MSSFFLSKLNQSFGQKQKLVTVTDRLSTRQTDISASGLLIYLLKGPWQKNIQTKISTFEICYLVLTHPLTKKKIFRSANNLADCAVTDRLTETAKKTDRSAF